MDSNAAHLLSGVKQPVADIMVAIDATLQDIASQSEQCCIQSHEIGDKNSKIEITSYNFGNLSTAFIQGSLEQELVLPINNNNEFFSLSFVVNGHITTSSQQGDFENIASTGSAHFCSHRFFRGKERYSACEQLQIVFICFKHGFMPEFDTLYAHSKDLELMGFQHVKIPTERSIQDCVNHLFVPRSSRGLRPMYIKGKTYELLALCADLLFSHIPHQAGVSNVALHRVHQARNILENKLLTPPKTHELAHLVGTNECSLKREFKAVFKISPYAYVIQRRMEHAYQQILTTDLPITTIAQNLGYNNSSHFTSTFFKHFGIKPGGLKQTRKSPVN